MTRSTLIREVENDLIAARARGMLKQPSHPRKTYTEVKAERAEKYKRWQAWGWWAAGILTAITVASKSCAL